MHSKIYVGQVKHKRYLPHEHGFTYRMFMMYLDLDELPTLFDRFLFWSARRFNLAYFNRKHHLGDDKQSLKKSVYDLVYKKENLKLNGPVRLLTHLSYFILVTLDLGLIRPVFIIVMIKMVRRSKPLL